MTTTALLRGKLRARVWVPCLVLLLAAGVLAAPRGNGDPDAAYPVAAEPLLFTDPVPYPRGDGDGLLLPLSVTVGDYTWLGRFAAEHRWLGQLWGASETPDPAETDPVERYSGQAATWQAWAAATAVLGLPVPDLASTVVELGPDCADLGLRVGDNITAVNGFDTMGATVSALMRLTGTGAGRSALTFVRDTTTTTVTVDADRRGCIVTVTGVTRRGPHVDTTGHSGYSSGLMTALNYVDAFTAGDLAGGKRVSGTGAVDFDGTVQAVQSVAVKAESALRSDADVMFVPAGQDGEARAGMAALDADIPVVAVSTVREAVDWLCAHGGRADGVCPTTGDAQTTGR